MNHFHGQPRPTGSGNGSGQKNQIGVNLVHTKFFFLTFGQDDEHARIKVRAAGTAIGRGFFNDFGANGGRESAIETIQLLVNDVPCDCDQGIQSAQRVAQVSAKYRPRLDEVEKEFRLSARRLRPRPYARRCHPGAPIHQRGAA